MAEVERETRAMQQVAKALQGLTQRQRQRVLAWAETTLAQGREIGVVVRDEDGSETWRGVMPQ